MNPRPGFVLEVDKSTPPILFHHGEGFRLDLRVMGACRFNVGVPHQCLQNVAGNEPRQPRRERVRAIGNNVMLGEQRGGVGCGEVVRGYH